MGVAQPGTPCCGAQVVKVFDSIRTPSPPAHRGTVIPAKRRTSTPTMGAGAASIEVPIHTVALHVVDARDRLGDLVLPVARPRGESPGSWPTHPQPPEGSSVKKTNASAVTRLLNKNGFVDGHAANNGEVVVVKFEGPPLRVDRAAKVLRDAGYSVDRYETDALKVLGKPEPARRLCVRGTYSVMIDADAWTLNYGIENIDTIREDVRAYIRQFIDDALDQLLVTPEPDRGRNLAGGNRRNFVLPPVCRQ